VNPVTPATPRQAGRFALRVLHLNVGLLVYGLSVAMMLAGGVGLGPWDVFHEGLSLHTPLTIGQAMILAGLLLIGISFLLARVRPGVGTVSNMALIGVWVDVFLARSWFPHPDGGGAGWALFLTGLVLNGLATGLYITAGLGAGPRDGFALTLAEKFGTSVRRARTGMEVVVLLSGWLLGGTVGFGTLVFAMLVGPLMQRGLQVTLPLERAYGTRTP